ncbi:Calcium-Binding Protein 1 [Manis pentadactyla]|nr:Calcium-Binding Protein 1 [Manis pentadactyla]
MSFSRFLLQVYTSEYSRAGEVICLHTFNCRYRVSYQLPLPSSSNPVQRKPQRCPSSQDTERLLPAAECFSRTYQIAISGRPRTMSQCEENVLNKH